jgi:hypothetical protein
MKCFSCFVWATLLLFSCKEKSRPAVSFYCWKTNVELAGIESQALHDNAVTRLYIRYFDVDKQPGETIARPVAPVQLGDSVKKYQVIPVVFIKKRVLDGIDTGSIELLAKNIYAFIEKIDQSQQLNNTEVQFDCDWTEGTKEPYFFFLRYYKKISGKNISATIRLHQVKYFRRTGIPPVDRGVLMYYNMGEINPGEQNSVYDKSTAAKYDPSLQQYPLPLDVALPVFAWAQQIRDGRVAALLNKVNESHFAKDANFIFISNSRLRAVHPCFKAGYYFRENDEVKLESVSGQELLGMPEEINKYLKKSPRAVIFYDLDSINMVRYEKDIYQKIVDVFN